MALPAPAAYWALDEGTGTSLADSSGNGHTGTRTNATWVTGKFSNGLNNAAAATGATIASYNVGTTYSIACWLRNWDGSDDGVVFGGAAGNYAFYLDSTDIYHSANSNFCTVAHGGGLSGATWHHLAVVRVVDEVMFYKDGAAIGSPQSIGAPNALTLTAILAYGNGTTAFHADLDELRVYAEALTAAQVSELYALNLGIAAITGTGGVLFAGPALAGSGTAADPPPPGPVPSRALFYL